jgi:hypothetical protein
LVEISSYPQECDDLSDLTISVISFAVAGIILIPGNGLEKTCIR